MDKLEFTVSAENEGARLDKTLSDAGSISRTAAQRLIDGGNVFVNSKTALKSVKLKQGDIVSADLPEPVEIDIKTEDIPLDIVYEDNDLLVVNKPKGMVVHPAPGNYDGTLVNALMYHCGDSLSGINGVIRPGIVHRIDKDTSGLLAVAKNDLAHASLAEQIKSHSFKREYRAVLVGNLKDDKGAVDRPIGRNPNDRKKQAVNGVNARNAVTHYEVLERFDKFCLCRFTLETGRTHQIRVHAASMGHPVAGDTVYGNPKLTYGLEGQCLHAGVLGLTHPTTGEYMEFNAPLPEYFTEFLDKIKKGVRF
ncbi:MAG: RluA family pseudouridine synthase [Clostridiales bacterium]|nr:RluA family pseudouridine synthase [Clostridiales bacterium]